MPNSSFFDLKDVGSVTEVSGQFWKHSLPITLTVDGIDIDDNKHLQKHLAPISLTEDGIDSDESEYEWQKHSLPITLTEGGMDMDDNDEQ